MKKYLLTAGKIRPASAKFDPETKNMKFILQLPSARQ